MNDKPVPHQQQKGSNEGHQNNDHQKKMYMKFAAMIVTSTTIMFGLMYIEVYSADHLRWSETRFFMSLIMGGTMTLVMLGFMLGMLKNPKFNALIALFGVALLGTAIFLARSQTTVQDRSYMSAMIPHHSIAILTSENSEIRDVRVCELAVKIIEAQRREISEMDWLIEDIGNNGIASTSAEAEARPIPSFEGTSDRSCPAS